MRYTTPVRTTLDLDERVLVAARAQARERGITMGTAISELALSGLAAEEPTEKPTLHGLVLLPQTSGHIITDEMVADALADD